MKEFATALRFRWQRLRLLAGRALLSLRRRGLRPTLARVLEVLGRGTPSARPAGLCLPGAVDARTLRLLPCATPRASIVVPVHNQLDHTLGCLASLARSGDATPFEVIVVDDASRDDSATVLPAIPGLRYLRCDANFGFIGACRLGATQARGAFIVYLNNDTAVQPGWLDALLDTFERHPDTGIAGSRLVYPDGRLQEAGGVIYRDGSTGNVGRFQDPGHPAFGCVREVDYCSGAAIAIPRDLHDALDGFDPAFAPAYYEDADLAMRVRAAGRRVRYQPASVVVHYEGVSSGTDPLQGVKAHQAINQARFASRWRMALAGHPTPDSPDDIALGRHARMRVLVIDADTPCPDRDSGSVRLSNLMRLLAEEGCAVAFLPETRRHAGSYTQALQAMGVECWHQPWIGDTARWFRQHGPGLGMVILSRHYVAQSHLPLVRRFAPQARVVFDTVDLHFLREEREARVAGSAALMQAAQATRARELALVEAADLTLVVSPVERDLLATEAPGASVAVLSNVLELPASVAARDGRRDLLFVGGFRHPPNVDAVRWLVEAVLPVARRRLPELRCHIVGADAPAEVLALGDQPGVVLHGHVPALDGLLAGCLVSVAPLRYGAGVKGKVNQAMAWGLPVVATGCAVEGMHLRAGEDALVANTPEAFAEAIVRLHEDAALWRRLSENGRGNVRRHFSFDAARQALRPLLAGPRRAVG